jgi:hypothetical protein
VVRLRARKIDTDIRIAISRRCLRVARVIGGLQ